MRNFGRGLQLEASPVCLQEGVKVEPEWAAMGVGPQQPRTLPSFPPCRTRTEEDWEVSGAGLIRALRGAGSGIALTPDGRFLFTSNRGHDTIAIFAINAETGMPVLAGHEPTGGSVPRDIAVDPSGEPVAFSWPEHTHALPFAFSWPLLRSEGRPQSGSEQCCISVCCS